ncbi:MAG: hypothetical protein AB1671_08720 [Thermodesulfobacteriota bacterium]
MVWPLVSAYPDYVLQLAALLADPLYRGANVPHGRGEPVLLIPGFLNSDRALGVMGRWLGRIGYQVYCSGIRWNIHCPNQTGEFLRGKLREIARQTRRPLAVIGHSLGGVLARFLGANFPEYIGRVVAVGSPIDGSMRVHPLIPFTFRMVQSLRHVAGGLLPPCARARRLECTCHFVRTAFAALPESVGFTAIFSDRDEIVDWRACVTARGDNHLVSGQHVGLIVNREVYRIIAHTLARHFSAPGGRTAAAGRPGEAEYCPAPRPHNI